MPTLILETEINADINIVFDLARSIDFHELTTRKTREKAIAGRTSGLIEMGETVTWEATHFGIRQRLSSTITAFQRPFHFKDEQVKGIFKCIEHDHFFEKKRDHVIMRDRFHFEAPLGILGKMFSMLVLKRYLCSFITARNQVLKAYAESSLWKEILQ